MNIRIIASLLLILSLTACDNTVSVGDVGRVLPNVTGGAGEVLVVMDRNAWEGKAGEVLQDVLKQEFPALPQSEPMFSVAQISPGSFQKVTRFHRSVVLVTLKDSAEEPQIRFRKDVWAKPQIVVQMEARTSEDIYGLIDRNRQKIQNYLVQHDRQRIAESYKESMDMEMHKMLVKNHSITMSIPRGYNVDVSSDEYTSVSIEANEFSQVIQIYEYPANGPEDLSSEAILAKRDEFTKKYVKGPREGSYMKTSLVLPPQFYDVIIEGKEFVEMRGLWELEGGFMGGPFVSHTFYDQKRNRIVCAEGYIFFPNQKKRVKIRQVEAIIYSMKIL